MAATTITRDTVVNDSGTFTAPVGDGTRFDSDFYNNFVMARIDQLFSGAGAYATLTVGGLFAAEGFGAHSFSAAGTGGNTIAIRNTTAGTTNYSGLYIGNDGSATAVQCVLTASSYTTNAPYYQDGLTVQCARVGGMTLAATHASGVIRFTAGGNSEKMRVTETGGLVVGDTTDPGAGALRLRVAATNNGLTVTDGVVTGVFFASDLSTIDCLAFGTSSNHSLFFGTNNNLQMVGLDVGGKLTIGAQSGNNYQVKGLTINQGNNDDLILALQSDDVAHGMTASAMTNTYADFCKQNATTGGVTFRGLQNSTGPGVTVMGCQATADTAKSTAANGAVNINGAAQSGTGVASLGTNGNIATIRDNGVTRFVFDAEGDAHADVSWTTFDGEDDVDVLNILTAHVMPPDDPLRAGFGEWLAQGREPLERMRLVTFNDNGRHFLNTTRLAMLHTGAIRQLAAALASTRLELQALQQRQLEG